MTTDNNRLVGWYRILLKLYPKAYRREYEEEMIDTLNSMFDETQSNADRRQLAIRVLKDYFITLTQENLYATEHSFNEVPLYAKRQLFLSTALVLPFFVVFIYNILSLYLRHIVPLANLEIHTWVIYSIVLPAIGLVITVRACLSSVYSKLMHREWREILKIIQRDWLFMYLLVVFIAFVAIF